MPVMHLAKQSSVSLALLFVPPLFVNMYCTIIIIIIGTCVATISSCACLYIFVLIGKEKHLSGRRNDQI